MAGTSSRRRPEKDGSVGLFQTLEASLEDLRSLMICRVCVRPLFEPYTIECGHTFCYGCLSRWFERDRIKKTCPDCRTEVLRAPAPAFLVRDMTQIFASRAELIPMGETTEEHKKWQEEEAALVEKDRSDTGPNGGLFRGCFRRGQSGRGFPTDYMARPPIRDVEDGVERCPRCTWELEDGLCQSCGYPSGDDEDFSEGDSPEYAVDFGDEGNHMGYHNRLFPGERTIIRPFSREYSPASLSEGDAASYQSRTMSSYGDGIGTPYDSTLEESYEGSDDGDEDAGSLNDFIVEDAEERQHSPSSSVRSIQWETYESSGAEDLQTQHFEDEHGTRADFDSDDDGMSLNTGPPDQYNLEEDSDEGPIPPSRRQAALQVDLAGASGSEDDAQPIALLRGRRHRPANWRGSNGMLHSQRSMPHHSRGIRTIGERSGAVHIDVDSDSDAPVSASQPVRNRRNHRPGALNEDSGAEGSSGTATIGRLSPRLLPTRRHNGRSGTRDSNRSPPAMIDSSSRRSVNSDNPDERESPLLENSEEPPGRTAPPFPHRNHSQDDAYLHQEDHRVPLENPAHHPSPLSSLRDRRYQISRRLSPLPPRSHRHSPASGPSRSSFPEGESQQAARERQTRKAERRAEHRRLKRERERRRSAEATRSAVPV